MWQSKHLPAPLRGAPGRGEEAAGLLVAVPAAGPGTLVGMEEVEEPRNGRREAEKTPVGVLGGHRGVFVPRGTPTPLCCVGFVMGPQGSGFLEGRARVARGGHLGGARSCAPAPSLRWDPAGLGATPLGPWDPELQGTERGGGIVTGSWVHLGTAWGCPQPHGGHRAPQAALCLRSPRRARAPHGWGSGREQRTKLIKGIK